MKRGLIVLGAILLILLLSIGMFTGTYNSLVTADEGVTGKWAQIESS